MLEANAAMKTIVRKDTGDDWKEYLRELSGGGRAIEEPYGRRPSALRSEAERQEGLERGVGIAERSDARIAKMKDGRTHLAYKAEHAVDLDTEIVVAAEVYHANQGDQDTIESVDRPKRI